MLQELSKAVVVVVVVVFFNFFCQTEAFIQGKNKPPVAIYEVLDVRVLGLKLAINI